MKYNSYIQHEKLISVDGKIPLSSDSDCIEDNRMETNQKNRSHHNY